MENYFAYYKGYQMPEDKKTNTILFLFVMVLSFLTLLSGFLGIFVSLGKGHDFAYIYETAPFVVVLSFLSVPFFLFSLFAFIVLRKKAKENSLWKEKEAFIEDGEGYTSIKIKYLVNDKIFIKVKDILILNKNEIKKEEADGYLKVSFHKDDKEYYILMSIDKETEDDFNE